jgi:hypothetical protein
VRNSGPFQGEFVRLGLGTNTRRDRAVARIVGDEGRIAWGEARHGQYLDICPSVLDRHPTIAGSRYIPGR